jgi:hypothetical protein
MSARSSWSGRAEFGLSRISLRGCWSAAYASMVDGDANRANSMHARTFLIALPIETMSSQIRAVHESDQPSYDDRDVDALGMAGTSPGANRDEVDEIDLGTPVVVPKKSNLESSSC